MSSRLRLGLGLVLLLVVACATTAFSDNVVYIGETPSSGMAGWGGSYGGYSGLDYSDSLWDYVYTVETWGGLGAALFGVQVHSDNLSDIWVVWTGGDDWQGAITYDPAFDFGGLLPHLGDSVAVAWWRNGPAPPESIIFGFQSSLGPELRPFDLVGNEEALDTGDVYSTSPEPGTLALASMLLLGAGVWRRRRRRR